MKVSFINPPFKGEHGRFSREQRSPAITKGGTFYYPMWLCYAAGVLEQDGFEVQLIDAPARRMSPEQTLAKVREFAPAIVVVDTSTPSIFSDAAFAAQARRLTGAWTVLVGTHPTALPKQSLDIDTDVQAVARREYEYTIRDVARRMRDGGGELGPESLAQVQGLSWRNSGGEVVNNPDRPCVENLDELPMLAAVYKRHLDVRDYFYTIAQYPQVAVFSGRGCPHQCCYCVYPQVMHGHKYRKRSVGNLIAEFQYVARELPEVREVFIEDDTFTVDKKRVLEFSAGYRAAGLKLSWIANSRADVDLETLRALRACRCRLLCVGFESGDQNVLDQMRKRLTVDRAIQFSRDARKAGILIHGCFIVGNPGETPQTLQTTLQYAKRLTLDTAQFFPLMVYPGTEAYEWARSNNYLFTEDYSRWNTSDGLHDCLISRPGLSNRDLVDFCDGARREFYLRAGYLAYRLRRLVTNPLEDGPRMWKSLKQFSKFIFAPRGRSGGPRCPQTET